jgi:hypothetical protein
MGRLFKIVIDAIAVFVQIHGVYSVIFLLAICGITTAEQQQSRDTYEMNVQTSHFDPFNCVIDYQLLNHKNKIRLYVQV